MANFVTLVFTLWTLWVEPSQGWILPNTQRPRRQPFTEPTTSVSSISSALCAVHKQSRKSSSSTTTTLEKSDKVNGLPSDDDDLPAGIVGAEFFGGNKQKEEFYDAQAEAEAGLEAVDDASSDEEVEEEDVAKDISAVTEEEPAADVSEDEEEEDSISVIQEEQQDDTSTALRPAFFDRFADRNAFDSDAVAEAGRQVQHLINQVLYDDGDTETQNDNNLQYASNVQWTSPLGATGTPLDALAQALDTYRRVDVAVVAGRTVDTRQYELQWELSLSWSTFWEPRVLLTGSSLLELDNNDIVSQVDSVYGAPTKKDVDDLITDQVVPRFWDAYHIGMTPSAERSPMISHKGGKGYSVVTLPGRWKVTPTLVDVPNNRDLALANVLPSHAFNSVLKTVGPTQQRYIPTTPLEVTILSSGNNAPPTLQWRVPLSVEFQSQLTWPAAYVETENDLVWPDGSGPTCAYEWCPPRRVAVAPFGGGPQDETVAATRKSLYEAVVSSTPPQAAPQFTFFKHAFKACFTEEGLGMAVYEWRPEKLLRCNQVGMELESDKKE